MKKILESPKDFKVTIIKKIQQGITNSLEPSGKNRNFSQKIEVIEKEPNGNYKTEKNNRNNTTNWMSSVVEQR